MNAKEPSLDDGLVKAGSGKSFNPPLPLSTFSSFSTRLKRPFQLSPASSHTYQTFLYVSPSCQCISGRRYSSFLNQKKKLIWASNLTTVTSLNDFMKLAMTSQSLSLSLPVPRLIGTHDQLSISIGNRGWRNGTFYCLLNFCHTISTWFVSYIWLPTCTARTKSM